MNLKKFSEKSLYKDRRHAGRRLAESLLEYKDRSDLLIFGLPRGGVPVAFEVAQKLNAPLDVLVVRKLGVPGHEELAMGAIANNGVVVFNNDILDRVPRQQVEEVIEKEKKELADRERKYRQNKLFPALKDRVVVLVDDGLATGATMKVAVKALRLLHPLEIIVAVPVAPDEICKSLEEMADQIICGVFPSPFGGVGKWYEDFSETTDKEVLTLLRLALH